MSVFFLYNRDTPLHAETHLPITAALCVRVCSGVINPQAFLTLYHRARLSFLSSHTFQSLLLHTHTHTSLLCFSLMLHAFPSALLGFVLFSAAPDLVLTISLFLSLFSLFIYSPSRLLFGNVSLCLPPFSLFLSIYCIHSFHPFLIHLRSLRCQRCSPSLPPSRCISREYLSTDSLELSAMRLQFTGLTHTCTNTPTLTQ